MHVSNASSVMALNLLAFSIFLFFHVLPSPYASVANYILDLIFVSLDINKVNKRNTL